METIQRPAETDIQTSTQELPSSDEQQWADTMGRVAEHFGDDEKGHDQAAGLIGAAGSVAVSTETKAPTFRENWRNGGKGPLSRFGSLLRRGVYKLTTPQPVRAERPFNEASPYGGRNASLAGHLSTELRDVYGGAAKKIADAHRKSKIETLNLWKQRADNYSQAFAEDVVRNPKDANAVRLLNHYSSKSQKYEAKIAKKQAAIDRNAK